MFCLFLFPMSISILSFFPWAWVFYLFYAYFKHISAYFSGTKPDFDDTSPWFMILRWYFSLHFLEKSHFAKVLNINDIILYLSRIMILWDFFREKTFLRERLSLSFVLQFSAERMWCPSRIKYGCYWYLYKNKIPQPTRVSRLGDIYYILLILEYYPLPIFITSSTWNVAFLS